MRKYYINDKQYGREEFDSMLNDAIHDEAIDSLPYTVACEEVEDTYERMLRVAKGLLEENFEVYVSDIYFRVAEE